MSKKPVQAPRWLLPVRLAGLAVFVGFIPLILGVPVGRRLFWTVAIAALPLGFTVAGFYAWRKACPLALFGQLGRFVRRPGQRKPGEWLARNYPLVQLGVLVAALALRNVATNGTAWALAAFLAVVAVAAAVVSLLYTGKTWCNYLCPVGLVEKLYNEPVVPGAQANAQCAPCTACKKNCPDIDLELGYWKEHELPSRRAAYYAWPGVVFGFYAYFWLVSGTWDYYFSGAWTREDGQAAGFAGPGLFFAPWLPRAVAAPLTLIVAGALSFGLFTLVEKLWAHGAAPPARARVRHRVLALAGFTAFIVFYCYAGQPTLRLAPEWVRQAAAITVVFVASVVLVRRWGRSETQYVQEKFARGILRRWEWGDEPPSGDLGDVYVIHTERTKQRESRLRAYKETLHDMVADGVVSRNELALLDKLRAQLGISDKDHQKILGELSAEAKLLFDPTYQGSVEKRLQTDQYRRELERLVLYAARQGRAPGGDALEALRVEHGVTPADHDEALAALRSEGGPILRQAGEALDDADRLRRAVRRAQSAERKRVDGTARASGTRSPSITFFAFLAHARAEDHVEHALALLAAARDPARYGAIRDLLASNRPDAAADQLAALDDPLARRAAALLRGTDSPDLAADDAADAAALLGAGRDASPYLRAGAVYVLSRFDDDASRKAVIDAATADPHPLVRETAIRVLGARGRLTRDVVSRAMEDPDPRVSQAVIRAVVPQGGRVTDPGALAQTTKGIGSSDPEQVATLDPRAALETLSTFEKMMLLRNVPLFVSLAPDDLEELSGIAHERRYVTGAHLCREGEDSDEVFILVSGRTQAWIGDRHVLGESGEGSCIGEMAALDKAPRTATVTAIAETRALVLDGKEFKDLLGQRPAIAQGVLQVVTRRLRGMIEQAAAS